MFSVYDPTSWRTSTAVFYAAVCLFAYAIPLIFKYVQNNKVQAGNFRVKRLWIRFTKSGDDSTSLLAGRKKIYFDVLIVGILLLCVKGFLACGVDILNGYKNNFESAATLHGMYDQTLEIGYRLLNVIVYNIVPDYRVFIFVCAAITLIPLLYLINKYHESIDVPITLFLYTSIFYFPGFCIMRLYMASGIGLLAADFMRLHKPYKALFWIVVACLFHTSAFCLLIPYVFLFFKEVDKKFSVICMAVTFCAAYFLRDSFSVILTGRYEIYEISRTATIGLQQFVYYIPIFLLMLFCCRRKKGKEEDRFAVVYVSSGLLIGLLGYLVSIFGRASGMFVYLVFVLGIYAQKFKMEQKKLAAALDILILLYGLARFWIYLSEYYVIEGIMPYVNVWGMEI